MKTIKQCLMVGLTRRWRRGRTWARLSCPAPSAPPPASCCCTAAACFQPHTWRVPSWRWSTSRPAGFWFLPRPPGDDSEALWQQSGERAELALTDLIPNRGLFCFCCFNEVLTPSFTSSPDGVNYFTFLTEARNVSEANKFWINTDFS